MGGAAGVAATTPTPLHHKLGTAKGGKPHPGIFVMIDSSRSEFGGHFEHLHKKRALKSWGGIPKDYAGELRIGKVTGVTAALDRNNFEYTVMVDDDTTECVEEEHVKPLKIEGMPYVNENERLVAVEVETHGTKVFGANLVRRNADATYEVRFVSDGSMLDGVPFECMYMPNEHTRVKSSPQSEPPDPLWMMDRKIQDNIDARWPIQWRIKDALERVKTMRPASVQPVSGNFIGKGKSDSEGFPAHPAPLPELSLNGVFVDTWAKYAGKVKFASTFQMGPCFPRFDAWIECVDAGEPLYFHAALPVYAGLICIGYYSSMNGVRQPEWVRASDVALIGVALYVQDELQIGFPDPTIDKFGMDKFGHECCNFIPGCTSTYMGDVAWVGGVFCLAPMDQDFELRDDVYNIETYHQILSKEYKKMRAAKSESREITITVNLILSTNYLASLRQVCSGVIKVNLSDSGLMQAGVRLKDILENRLNSKQCLNPKRPVKALSEMTHEDHLVEKHVHHKNAFEGATVRNADMETRHLRHGLQSLAPPKAPGQGFQPPPGFGRSLNAPGFIGQVNAGVPKPPPPPPPPPPAGAGVGLFGPPRR
eukprot:TRINITY_DN34644_c0_g1_i1.p1 TRINITY_DN34644_c0_g1~~TRINITY_DN34644_c0_g1_i1.p1  ORF type:complete len:594 (-),score=84.47 TRINITY_DN34644_c0_g1_i1:114-1895(-)